MGSELKIPSVTPNDLHYFRNKHFHKSSYSTFDHAGHGASKSSDDIISTHKGVLNEDEEIQNEEDGTYFEDDDGLGYYPDGVKRALTDEQIAMFRHSEIYALIRKRQIQDEACDIDEDVVSPPLNVGSISRGAVNIGQELDIGDSDSNDDEEYLKFLEAEEKQMKADRNHVEAEHKAKKRKFSRVDGSKPHDRAPTHRRIARELDDAIMSHDVLEYDEEKAETLDLAEEPSRDGEDKGFKLKEFNSEASTTVHTISPTTPCDPPKGRKIWWPTIEKR